MSLRHVPEGRGHAYERDPDQRVPFRPVAGEPVELRVTASADIEAVTVELGDARRLTMSERSIVPDEDPRYGRTRAAGEGHLSSASSYDGEGRRAWVTTVVAEGDQLRYRFLSGDEATEWFECEIRAERWCASFPLAPGDRVIGFGERFDALDQRGRFVDTAVYDQYKGQGARSYLPMPFALVVGEHSYGIHVDTGRRCFFDVGVTDPSKLTVEADEECTVVLLEGTPAEIVRAFSERTSPQLAAPPDWIYRLWLSGNEWNSDARVRAEVAAAEQAGVPVGALVIEAWSDEQTFSAWNDAEHWPDPKQLVDDLHEAGIKVLLWQIPLAPAEAEQRVMIERGYCVRNEDGTPYRNPGGWFNDALLLDFTSEEATEWWLAKRRYLVDDLGIDGFKTDGGEHAWPSSLRYADGTRGEETNNRYPVLYQAAYHRLAPVTFSRAGFTGSGGYPCHWAGDEDSTWEAFRASIVAGLTAAVSGVFYWGWDIGGFSGPLPSVELYLRATAMAALCPIMQLHSEFNFHRLPSRDRTPWNIAAQTGDATVVPFFRGFAELRERLVPYLAEAGERAARERVPIMRPLALDHPGDDAVWEFPFQYLLGDALLVAPVCEPGVTEQQVYLPAGEWVDLGGGKVVAGGELVVVPAPVDRIPVFCTAARAQALRPLFSDDLVEVS
jgi:alpha-glucosidase (family GH31 glycosyl hydrolase)